MAPNVFPGAIFWAFRAGTTSQGSDFPSWLETALIHLGKVFCATLNQCDPHKPDFKFAGRLLGHAWAAISHAKKGTAFFSIYSPAELQEIRQWFGRVEAPVRVLINAGLNQAPWSPPFSIVPSMENFK
ncbi:MAG TPA: hypothetical protein VNH84_10980 [Candidatus Saccharimonadales bacterium]|nr:hypothetical protein [Candidatus Saccharimonadales bacterium]